MDVQCAGCKRKLRVPDGSSGRHVRCPACKHKFIVPTPAELMDATISGWLVEDLENVKTTQARHRTILGS